MTNVLIADDHTVVRQGLRQILSSDSQSRIQFGSATNCCLKNTSFGVLKPRVLRGLLFNRAATGPLHEQLSDREFQVMSRLAMGKTVSEIADELLLSIKTISTYRARVLEKMKMGNNAELTRYALQHQLVD